MAIVMLDVLGLVERALTDVEEDTRNSRHARAAQLKASADSLQDLLDSCAELLGSLDTTQDQAATLPNFEDHHSVQDQHRKLRQLVGAYYRIRGSCIALRTVLNDGGSRDLAIEELQSYTTDVDLRGALLTRLPELLLPDGELSKDAEMRCWMNAPDQFDWLRLQAFATLLQRLRDSRAELLRLEPELRTKAADVEADLARRSDGDA